MKEPNKDPDGWQPCPTGELTQAVRRIQARRRDRQVAGSIGLVSGILIAFLTASLVVRQIEKPAANQHQRLTCEQVKDVLPAFVAGRLDEQTSQRVQIHLVNCPRCRPVYQQMVSQTDHIALQRHDAPRKCPCCSPG